jgi:hypothetical protein
MTVSESGVSTPVTKIFVNSEQIEFVNRLKVDQDSDDFMPSIEIDMLRAFQPDLIDPGILAKAEGYFKLLSQVPGLKCSMFTRKR